MRYRRMPIEIESPEEQGYDTIDHNLSESSVTDADLELLGLDPAELLPLTLAYTDHLGHPELRELIAADGEGLAAGDVLLTPGAAGALFIVATALLSAGDHLVVVRPNYATNLETPRAIGAEVDTVELRHDDGWALDPDELLARIRPDTRLVSITLPHNPTGTTMAAADLEALVAAVERRGVPLLVDETYRELCLDDVPPLPVAADLSPSVISVSSLSKAYGLPGIRTGWVITRDPERRELFLAAKEQMVICGSVLDETVALAAVAARDRVLPPVLERCRHHRDLVAAFIAGRGDIDWVVPTGGVVGFPRIADGLDPEVFHAALADERTAVGPGHWFEQPRSFFRLGFGWPGTDELTGGLAALGRALDAAAR